MEAGRALAFFFLTENDRHVLIQNLKSFLMAVATEDGRQADATRQPPSQRSRHRCLSRRRWLNIGSAGGLDLSERVGCRLRLV